MSPAANPTLGDLVSWTPTCLRGEATALENSLENIDKARQDLASTLETLPDVWTGISANAVRNAMVRERRYVDVLEKVFLQLRRCYNDAYQDVSTSHDTFMTVLSGIESDGFSVDHGQPAAGPITVSTVAAARSDSGADGSRLAAAERAAESIARAAGAVLDADSRHAEAIATLVAESDADSARPPVPNPEPLATAKNEKHLTPHRYGSDGLLGPTATQLAINGLSLTPYAGTSILVGDLMLDMAENRAPLGEALVDAFGAKLSGRVGKALGSGLYLAGAEKAGYAVGEIFGPEMVGGGIDAVLDATVGTAGRSIDERWGTQFFGPHTNEQLTRRALRDQEKYGG